MNHAPYTYTVLRYFHDVATGEFVNVGVVLVSPEARFAGVRLRDRPGRLVQMFSDFDKEHYRRVVSHLGDRLQTLCDRVVGLPYAQNQRDARAVAISVLREDDSAFQWSPMGSGVSSDLGQTLDRTYERLVVHHEATPPRASRSDEDVWRSFRKSLEQKGRLPALRKKRVSTAHDEIEFQHAWKNGKWHCLEPLSFDLQKPKAIQHKAHTCLGGLTSICEAADDLRVYFLVGKPRRDGLQAAYERALRILSKAPVEHRIVAEGQEAQFVESIKDALPGRE